MFSSWKGIYFRLRIHLFLIPSKTDVSRDYAITEAIYKSIRSCKFHRIRSISQLRELYALTWTSSTHLMCIDVTCWNIWKRVFTSKGPLLFVIVSSPPFRPLIKTCLNAGTTLAIKTCTQYVTRSPTDTSV